MSFSFLLKKVAINIKKAIPYNIKPKSKKRKPIKNRIIGTVKPIINFFPNCIILSLVSSIFS